MRHALSFFERWLPFVIAVIGLLAALVVMGAILNLAVDLVANKIRRAGATELVQPPAEYARARTHIPDRHWSYVGSVQIDRTSGGQARKADMSIHLTPHRQDSQLWHEVGHIVYYASPEIEVAWRSEIWPDGKPSEPPVSKYGRTNEREAFAEAYKEFIEHGALDQPRQDAFMRRYVFLPHELPKVKP